MKHVESKNNVDFGKKLQIIRSVGELANLGSFNESKLVKQVSSSKKRINIPICDVHLDPDYETLISPSFVLPANFIRHTKKIGDENDISIDYNLEEDDIAWLKAHPKISTDKEIQKNLNLENFERLIDILEKHTGLATNPIPLSLAERFVAERVHWSALLTSRVLPIVYQYWLSKRDRLGRPLCRRYWPQTSSSDTNPHHCFRPRDKERYRLRKQQRKNDIEAYRKMQKLRQEFSQARELMTLVLERELLGQADAVLQRELFERQVLEMSEFTAAEESSPPTAAGDESPNDEAANETKDKDCSVDSLSRSPEVAATEEPAINTSPATSKRAVLKNSVYGLECFSPSPLYSFTPSMDYSTFATTIPPQQTSSSELKLHISRSLLQNVVGGNPPLPLSANASSRGSELAAMKKERKERSRVRFSSAPGAGTTAAGISTTAAAAALLIEAPHYLNPQLPGPRKLCRPAWPHFLSFQKYRDTFTPPRNYAEYMDELESAYPKNPTYGVPGFSRERLSAHGDWKRFYKPACHPTEEGNRDPLTPANISHGAMSKSASYVNLIESNSTTSKKPSSAICNPFATAVDPNRPSGYRSRVRVGRGGRLVVDRIPIFCSNEAEVEAAQHRCIYPTTLPIVKPKWKATDTENYPSVIPLVAAVETPTAFSTEQLQGQTVEPAQGIAGENVVAMNVEEDKALSEGTSLSEAASGDKKEIVTAESPYKGGFGLFHYAKRTARVPPLYPPTTAPLPDALFSRIAEICNCSDSEDERVEIVFRPNKRTATNAEAALRSSTQINQKVVYSIVV